MQPTALGARMAKDRITREAPLDAAALEALEASDIVVVSGSYDRVQQVLGALEMPFTAVAPHQLARDPAPPRAAPRAELPGRRRPARRRPRPLVRGVGRLALLHRLGARARPGAGVPAHGPVQPPRHGRRRRADRDPRRREPVPAGRDGRRRRAAVVARGRLAPDRGARPQPRAGADHLPRARPALRRARGGGPLPVGRGRGLPHDQPLLPAADRAAVRPPAHGRLRLLRREGHGRPRWPRQPLGGRRRVGRHLLAPARERGGRQEARRVRRRERAERERDGKETGR